MAVVNQGEYEELEAEYKASQQQLASKDQALKIFQEQLRNSEFNSQRLQQEINQLRSQLTRVQVLSPQGRQNSGDSIGEDGGSGTAQPFSIEEKERYIQEMESAQVKISELERHIQVLEDEKAELGSERDYFSGKCDSLTKCLEEERNITPPSHSTLQSAIEENRLLKLELVDVKAERDHANSRIERYKRAVERKKAIEASTNQQVPVTDKRHQLQDSLRRVKELEALANNLSESVKEKSIALLHQKKANKMLATRIAELEHKLKVVEVSGLWTDSGRLPNIGQVPLTPQTSRDTTLTSPQRFRERDSPQNFDRMPNIGQILLVPQTSGDSMGEGSVSQKRENQGNQKPQEGEGESNTCKGQDITNKQTVLVAEQ